MENRLLPFEKTIIRAISRCSNPTTGEIMRLFALIKETEIKFGHDEIIQAIDNYFNFPGNSKWARDIREVKENILAKKRAIEKEVLQKINRTLDDLEKEAKLLLNILEERRPKDWSGYEEIVKRIEKMKKLLDQANKQQS